MKLCHMIKVVLFILFIIILIVFLNFCLKPQFDFPTPAQLDAYTTPDSERTYWDIINMPLEYLNLNEIPPIEGEKLEYSGLSFHSIYGTPIKTQQETEKIIILTFQNNIQLLIYRDVQAFNKREIELDKSDYDFLKNVYSLTYKSALVDDRKTATLNQELLYHKLYKLTCDRIINFETPDIRGFVYLHFSGLSSVIELYDYENKKYLVLTTDGYENIIRLLSAMKFVKL